MVGKVWAERLKWLREINRYSQKEIATEIKMSLNGYQKIEYGDRDPKLDVLIRLATFYKETTDFILGLTDLTIQLREMRDSLDSEKKDLLMRKRMLDEDYISEDTEMNEILSNGFKHALTLYRNKLMNYMFKFVEVPFTNPKRDRHLKELFPVDFKIENNLDGSMSIKLIANNGQDLGELETIHIRDDFDKQIEKVESLIEIYNNKLNRNNQ